MNKVLIMYHRVDFDGVFSCLVAKQFQELLKNEVVVFGWNYGDPIPPIQDWLRDYYQIILVDISLPDNEMKTLYNSDKVVWIDHHITAIESSRNNGFDHLPGLRKDGIAACELTWEYFRGTEKKPYILELIGTYDVFNKPRFNWDVEVLPIQYALSCEYGVSVEKLSPYINELLENKHNEVQGLQERGAYILKYMKNIWKSQVKNYSFEVLIDNRFKAVCMLTTTGGSMQFESVFNDYDLTMTINKKGDDYVISMYSEPSKNLDFSCGEYMKKYCRGGGHKGAAGGRLTKEQFMQILEDRKF